MRPDRLSLLAEAAAKVSGIHEGIAAFDARLEELAGGIPSRGEGAGGGGGNSPTETIVVARAEGKPDPYSVIRNRFDVRLARLHRAALDVWELYESVASPRPGVEKMADPGCELCAQVEDHWCPVYGSVEIVAPPKRKGDKERIRVLKLCEFCYRFQWPSRAGRLPTYDEVLAHSEGRRPRMTKGA